MAGVRTTSVDGVQTVWTPCDGPMRAVLMFRTGSADETLETSGVTHLIEHLVLSEVPDFEGGNNGHVDQTTTTFHTVGEPGSVAHFVESVCRRLRALPAQWLDRQKTVLAAEAERRKPAPGDPLMLRRFGPRAHGLAVVPEYGVPGARLEELQRWADTRFTRGNALLVLSVPPPAGLRLNLEDGPWHAPPAVVDAVPGLPAWFADDSIGGAGLSSIVPRSVATSVLLAIARAELHHTLREELALSYAPGLVADPLTARDNLVILYADSAQDGRSGVAAGLSEIVGGLADRSEVGAERLDAARESWRRSVWQRRRERGNGDAASMDDAVSWGHDLLHGRRPMAHEQLDAELNRVTVDELADVGEQLARRALFALPTAAETLPLHGDEAPPLDVPELP